jgi:UDP-N-acetyl-D-galactosamine dehydrogenase
MNHLPKLTSCKVAIVGLGYVGLPLAIGIATLRSCHRTGSRLTRSVIGFDINSTRLEQLKKGIDRTNEVSPVELQDLDMIEYTDDPSRLSVADVFIVTVPTPIDSANRPDLEPLINASIMVGQCLKIRAYQDCQTKPIVIYESTVFPGATEEVCVPLLERESGLLFNQGFFCGYSPERINPGDKLHKLANITKVTSGSTPESAVWIDDFYGSFILAGTHSAPSLKVAEAAKVIENTQRDLNIALVNELAIIFGRLGIDTLDVLEAAGSKWNFLPFRPGLVGGHCIGVDPYYLTHRAEQLGYHPQVVLAGRRINDGMAHWLIEQLVIGLAERHLPIVGARFLVLGLAFKENCPDMRNTKVVDLIRGLERYGIVVDVVDPWVNPNEALSEHGLKVNNMPQNEVQYTGLAVVVAHTQFIAIDAASWRSLVIPGGLIFDLKGIVPRELSPIRL